MTTQPTPSSTDQGGPGFAVNTSPLYGILVTEKSFLLGKRSLALQSHASYLAHRIIGDRLPVELCDQIGSDLAILQVQSAERLWKSMKDDPSARTDRFHYSGRTINLTASEKVGRARYFKLSKCEVADGGTVRVQAAEVHLDVPGGARRGNNKRYTHLSASLVQPGVSSVLAPGVVSRGTGISFAEGAMLPCHQPANATQPAAEVVCIRWDGQSGGAARLLQLDEAEASIRGWNQALIEALVEQLELKAVIVRGEEGTRGSTEPRLRLLQRLRWGQEGVFRK